MVARFDRGGRFGVGWELFNSTDTPSVAYIDEVVFDAARIGCNN
jgi:hypothetical protein